MRYFHAALHRRSLHNINKQLSFDIVPEVYLLVMIVMLLCAHGRYYTTVAGLGESAADVVFEGGRGVFCEAMDKRRGGRVWVGGEWGGDCVLCMVSSKP